MPSGSLAQRRRAALARTPRRCCSGRGCTVAPSSHLPLSTALHRARKRSAVYSWHVQHARVPNPYVTCGCQLAPHGGAPTQASSTPPPRAAAKLASRARMRRCHRRRCLPHASSTIERKRYVPTQEGRSAKLCGPELVEHTASKLLRRAQPAECSGALPDAQHDAIAAAEPRTNFLCMRCGRRLTWYMLHPCREVCRCFLHERSVHAACHWVG